MDVIGHDAPSWREIEYAGESFIHQFVPQQNQSNRD
jgi:hypothetical protein